MNSRESEGHPLAQAAASFIGIPFRLHGRDPEWGLDCVGLVHASLLRIGRRSVPPEGYRLRNSDPQRWCAFAQLSGLMPADGAINAGDVLLVEPGPGQQHLLIAESARSAIHAHAGLRRIVRERFSTCPPLLAHWRLN